MTTLPEVCNPWRSLRASNRILWARPTLRLDGERWTIGLTRSWVLSARLDSHTAPDLRCRMPRSVGWVPRPRFPRKLHQIPTCRELLNKKQIYSLKIFILCVLSFYCLIIIIVILGIIYISKKVVVHYKFCSNRYYYYIIIHHISRRQRRWRR